MTRTPPLVRTVVVWGVLVTALVLVAVNVVVHTLLAERLDGTVTELLLEREQVVRAEGADVTASGGGPAELAARLQGRGLRAVVCGPDGTTVEAAPASPVVQGGLPSTGGQAQRSRVVELDDGTTVEVFVGVGGVSDALRQLLVLQVIVSLVGLAVAAALLALAARRALGPVSEVAAAAARTAAGSVGERLRPDRPGTELGRMATSYDRMLDALEASLDEARAAQRARSLVAAVVDGSTDAILVQGLDGTVLTWNPAAVLVYGWTAEEAVGRHVSELVPADALGTHSSLVAELVAAGAGVRGYEARHTTRGGELLPVSVRLSPVSDEEGTITAIAVGARDVTEQRWLAATLDETLARLQAAADEARAAEEAARRFLADAAHQLRTPMAGIRASAEALLRGVGGEDADRLLVTLVRETSRAARLIASLLRVARLDRGVELASEDVDLVALCRADAERLGLLAPDLDVRVGAGADGVRALADRAACEEVLSNLGDNARRHARTTVRYEVSARDGCVVVAVRDDGPGVAPEHRDLVFERFASLDGRGGSGLGLPIARGLARAMGGDLVCDGGFVLSLPAQGATTPERPGRGEGRSSTVPSDPAAVADG
ncbi:PAS domain-containing sensor histidine kinase [Aquipuribacter sp. SD81]|uniref:PAS domain-containing sensor histidine kinase n=1 Tax=Aquipuribacter sp. SD81 TaxID=3127703 RepID=UPI003017702D